MILRSQEVTDIAVASESPPSPGAVLSIRNCAELKKTWPSFVPRDFLTMDIDGTMDIYHLVI